MIRDIRDYLTDIGDMIDLILSFTENISYIEFAEDKKTQFTAIRAFEVIREAA